MHDLESERNVLAIMLNDEPGLITAMHTLTQQDFYNPTNQALFTIMTGLYTKAIKPTYLELCKEATKAGIVKGTEPIEEIADSFVTSETLSYWIKNVKDKAKRRKLKTLLLLGEEKLRVNQDIDQVLSEFETAVIALNASDSQDIDTGKDMAKAGREAFQEAQQNKGKLVGLNTGLGKLNRLTGGWKAGDLVILAAETGKGKTAFSLNFIVNACVWQQRPTFYINSEMSKKQVVFRLASIITGLTNDIIKFGECNQTQELTYEGAMKTLEQSPFFHYHSPALELKNVVAAIRKMKIQQNIQFVIVDYVGRMEKTTADLKEWQVLEQIVKALKTLAQELNLAVIVVAQLNDDQRLQGAKRMENEADIFLRLLPMTEEQQQAFKNEHKYKYDPNYLVHVKKNRDGQSDMYVPTLFQKPTLRVIDIANGTTETD